MRIRDFREHFLSLTPEERQEVMALYRELLAEMGESEVSEYALDYDTNEDPNATDYQTCLLNNMAQSYSFLKLSLEEKSILQFAVFKSKLKSALKEYESQNYDKNDSRFKPEYLEAAEWVYQ